MFIYKNISSTAKTFHGVTFQPGEVKEVPKAINHSKFIRLTTVPKEPPKRTESAEKSQVDVDKEQKASKQKKMDPPKSDTKSTAEESSEPIEADIAESKDENKEDKK